MLEILKEQSLAAALTALGIAARVVLSLDPPTPLRVIRQVIAGAFVGAAVAAALADYGLAAPTKGAIVGVSAMVAEDVLRYLIAIAGRLTADPDCLIQALRRRWGLEAEEPKREAEDEPEREEPSGPAANGGD